jgi:hypothetical protein
MLASGIVGQQSVQQWDQWGPMRGLPVMKRTLSVCTEVQLLLWRAKEEREKRVRETSRREVDCRAGHNQRAQGQDTCDGDRALAVGYECQLSCGTPVSVTSPVSPWSVNVSCSTPQSGESPRRRSRGLAARRRQAAGQAPVLSPSRDSAPSLSLSVSTE